MPEISPSSPEARCSALEKFFQNQELVSSKARCQSRCMAASIHSNCGNPGGDHRARLAPIKVQKSPGASDSNGRTRRRGRGARPNPRLSDDAPLTGPGRKPGTSRYYGVRFRPDLNKWVAEIRVAEWKAVDKKVWLGTFETEKAAAHGVDLARKLLKCKKNHPPNLHCAELEAYSKQIPPHLILTDLTATSMFKAATLFIKHECKTFAASFDDTPEVINPGSSAGPGLNQTPEAWRSADSSDVLDLDDYESDDCGFSDMIHEYYSATDHYMSGLEADISGLAMANFHYELGMSSSPSSCNSPASCVTLETLQGQETASEWGIGDCGVQCCSSASSGMMPEMMEGMSIMETTLAEHMDVGAASHQWEADSSLFPSWPALQLDSSSCPSPCFALLPDLAPGLPSYIMSPMQNRYVVPGDLDPWPFSGVHTPPFQHGPSGWP